LLMSNLLDKTLGKKEYQKIVVEIVEFYKEYI
jgi:hypothetical protein